jgi:hypothetical protein
MTREENGMRWIAIDEESGTGLIMEDGEIQTLCFGHLLAEDGTLQRDVGNDTLQYDGQANVEDDEFQMFDFDLGFQASVEWDGSRYIMVEENEMESKTYKTETAAKRAANKPYNPVVVELSDGSFDWYPLGHPLPEDAVKVSFWTVNQWRKV